MEKYLETYSVTFYMQPSFVVLFGSSLSISSLGGLVKYRNNWNYNALGTSESVPEILLASITPCTLESSLLLVHGEAKYGQYRAHRTLLEHGLRIILPVDL